MQYRSIRRGRTARTDSAAARRRSRTRRAARTQAYAPQAQAPQYPPQAYAAPTLDPYSALEQRVRTLEMRLPNTKLLANSFMSRAFAVWGHYFVAQLVISLVVGVIIGIISVIFGAAVIGSIGNIMQNSR